jgi:hypothetical protein
MPRPAFKFKVEWDAPEHEHKVRSQDWFVAMGIIVISLAVVALILGNVILAILIIIAAASLTLFINKEPNMLHLSVDELGVVKEHIQYPFSTLDSFWIDEDHPHKKMILKSKKVFMPLIIIPIGDDVDTDRLYNIMSRHIEEEYHPLPFVEVLLEYLGF